MIGERIPSVAQLQEQLHAEHQHIAYLKHQLDGMEFCHEKTARALLDMEDERDIALLRVGLLEERVGEMQKTAETFKRRVKEEEPPGVDNG